MKLLITGSEGQIGTSLTKYAVMNNCQVLALNRVQLDITDKSLVDQIITTFSPDVIINAAAYTAVDKAETESSIAYSVNKDGVAYLAHAAAQNHSALIHLSTDYVFSGQKSKPYHENDLTCPCNVYGKSKQAGEMEIARYCSNHIIIRTSWIFGEYGHNFVKTMLRLAQSKHELSIVGDQVGAPTYAGDIALTLLKIAHDVFLKKNHHLWGTYHYSGMPNTTWAEFAQLIFYLAYQQQLINQKPKINIISSSEYHTPANRPMNSCLDCSKILFNFGIQPSDWKRVLKDTLGCYL